MANKDTTDISTIVCIIEQRLYGLKGTVSTDLYDELGIIEIH